MKKTKFIKRLSANLATIILLLISGAGFVAGYLNDTYSDNASDLRQQAGLLTTERNRMESRAQLILQQSISNDFIARDYLNTAELFDNHYGLFNETFTDAERSDTYLSIVQTLLQMKNILLSIEVVKIYVHFVYLSNTTDYVISSKAQGEGYDYIISMELWDQYSDAVYARNLSYYASHIPQTVNLIYEEWTFPNPSLRTIYGPNWPQTEQLYFAPVWEIDEEIQALLVEADDFDDKAETTALSVSVSTVGMLLATAMISRITERKSGEEFEELKSEVLKVEQEKRRKDFISLPVLLVALALSALGFLFIVLL